LVDHVMADLDDNLFNSRGLWQIDANLGVTAGIAEMLMQSHLDGIDLLPALPAAWPSGHVKGLRARGGFEVDIYWEAGRLARTEIHSLLGQACTSRYRDAEVNFDTEAGGTYAFGGSLEPLP